MVTVKDLMREEVFSIRADRKVKELLQLFVEKQVSGVPVVKDNDKLVGIVTDADILGKIDNSPSFIDTLTYIIVVNKQASLSDKINELLDTPVEKLMTRRVVTVSRNTGLSDVSQILSNRQFKKLPVVDGDKLVGVVSRSDVVRYLVREFLQINSL